MQAALARLNPALTAEALEEALRKLTRPEGVDLIVSPVPSTASWSTGSRWSTAPRRARSGGAQARVIDFDDPEANDGVAVNQFAVVEHKRLAAAGHRALRQRPAAGGRRAQERGRRERHGLHRLPAAPDLPGGDPGAVGPNALLVISDGVEARVGTLTRRAAEPFKPWRTVHRAQGLADALTPELQVVIEGLAAPRLFLDLLRGLHRVRGRRRPRVAKKMAGYHQFHAVQVAVGVQTLRAARAAPGSVPAGRRGLRSGPPPGRGGPGTGASGWSGTPRARARA